MCGRTQQQDTRVGRSRTRPCPSTLPGCTAAPCLPALPPLPGHTALAQPRSPRAVGSWARIENKAVIGEDVFIKVGPASGAPTAETSPRAGNARRGSGTVGRP